MWRQVERRVSADVRDVHLSRWGKRSDGSGKGCSGGVVGVLGSVIWVEMS